MSPPADRPPSPPRTFRDVYPALRSLAAARLRATPQERTLGATELVHEVYLRLVEADPDTWREDEHLLASAATAIRWVLVDRARSRLAKKRGGGKRPAELHDIAGPTRSDLDLLALHEALDRLELHDARLARLVQLRYFGGATIAETGRVLGLSPATVKRDWLVAKARLLADLGDGGPR